MAINDLDYCREHGLSPCDRNLAYVRRVRVAGAFLRNRLLDKLEAARDAAGGGIRGPNAPEAIAHRKAYQATVDFEAAAMAARRLGRDRQSRRAQAQRVRLAHAAPLRSMAPQADVDGLALFDLARSPVLL